MIGKTVWGIVFGICVILVSLSLNGMRGNSSTLSAKPAEITKACQKSVDEYLLVAERLLDGETNNYPLGTMNTQRAVGYILLSFSCAALRQ